MRELFLLDPGVVFLNHGSFGACPAEVLAAQHDWQRQMEQNPVEFLSRRSAALLRQARTRLATYLGARADDIVFLSNATTGVNTIARSLELQPGDEVLTTTHEYGACDAAWAAVCGRVNARYRRIAIPLPFESARFCDRMLAAVGARTRAIYVSHIASTTAVIFPILELCQRARQRNILTIIDGAHGPGHVPLNLEALGADFYLGNCHKWLCAPKGTAFLFARAEHHARVKPFVVSWGTCAESSGLDVYDAYTGSSLLERRLQWQGTRDISPFLAVPAAIDFQERHDWQSVRRRCHELAVDTKERILGLTGKAAVCRNQDFGQMVAIALPECDLEVTRRALFERFRIEVPLTSYDEHRFIRVSFQAYNTKDDADALVAALAELFRR